MSGIGTRQKDTILYNSGRIAILTNFGVFIFAYENGIWLKESIVYWKIIRISISMNYDGLPSNGLAFSCRERATTSLQKTNDLVREAVGCNAGLDGRYDTAPY